MKITEIENEINSHNKRFAIKTATNEIINQIIVSKADKQNIEDGSSILGSINGLTEGIKIRVYNCSDTDLNNIKNNYEVTNIRTF